MAYPVYQSTPIAEVELITSDEGVVNVEVKDLTSGISQVVARIRPTKPNDAHVVYDPDNLGVSVETPLHSFAARKDNLL